MPDQLTLDLPTQRQPFQFDPDKWHPVGASHGRYSAWFCPRLPDVIVRHCGHPTALRPYYVTGGPDVHRKFRLLADAQAAALEAAGLAPKTWRST